MHRYLLHLGLRPRARAFIEVMSAMINIKRIQSTQDQTDSNRGLFIIIHGNQDGIDPITLCKNIRHSHDGPSFSILLNSTNLGMTQEQLTEWGFDAALQVGDYLQLTEHCQRYFEAEPPEEDLRLLEAMSEYPKSAELINILRSREFQYELAESLIKFLQYSSSINQRPTILKQLITSAFPGNIRLTALRELIQGKTERINNLSNYLDDDSFTEPMKLFLLNYFEEAHSSRELTEKLWVSIEDSSPLIRYAAARSIFAQALKMGPDGSDYLKAIISRKSIPIETKTLALRGLIAMGEPPPPKREAFSIQIEPDFVKTQSIKLVRAKEILVNSEAKVDLRNTALVELGDLVDPVRYRSICLAYIRNQEDIFTDAAFSALMNPRFWTTQDMEEIVSSEAIETRFRVAALISIIQRASQNNARRILKSIFADPKSTLHAAALTAIKLADDSQRCLLIATTQNSKLGPALRIEALRHLAEKTSHNAIDLCQELMSCSEPLLSQTACELWYRQSGLAAQAHLESQLPGLSIEHQHAALEGMLGHKQLATILLLTLILETSLELEVRLRAFNYLKSSPSTPSLSKYLREIDENLARERALSTPVITPPELPAKEDLSFATTEPNEPVALAAELLTELPPHPNQRQSQDHTDELKLSDESEPAIESFHVHGQLLAKAFEEGKSGFESLKSIVTQPQFSEDHRVNALRRMIQLFDEDKMQPVLEYALTLGTPQLQHTALTGRITMTESSIVALESTISDLANSSDVRLRALRKLQGLDQHKSRLTPICETLFYDYSSEIRRASLELVFPSLRYAQKQAIEANLINLFKDHSNSRVRQSAALAMGSFGGEDALAELREAGSKLFGGRKMNRAVQHAITVLESRFPDS